MELTRPFWPTTFTEDSGSPAAATRRARAVLAGALATGVATTALFWHAGLGLNFLLWTMLVIAACLVSVRPRRLMPAAYGAIAAALLLAFSVARFAGDWALAIAAPTDLALLAVLPVALRDQVDIAGVARLPVDALRSLRAAPRAALEASRLPGVAIGGRHEPLLAILKGIALGLPVTGVFVALLSADVDFQTAVWRVAGRLGDAASLAAWTLSCAACGLLAHTLVHRDRSAAATTVQDRPIPYRHMESAACPARAVASALVATSTWLVILAQVAVVFAVFVAVNLRNLFGGDALVRAPGSLTYAKYLHAGFGQLLLASVLSTCLVVSGHRLLRPREPLAAQAPVPGGRMLVGAECTLLALTSVTVASCAQRLAIYEDAYGATRQRLGVAFVLLAVLGALALTACKAVRRGWRGYGGALSSFLVGLAVLASTVNADAYVAGTNLDRAARGRPLDLGYLSSLSQDARGALTHPYVVANEGLRTVLATSYCSGRPQTDWRGRRGFGRCAP
jgi:hypothetical protein